MENKVKLLALIGISASGKSTYARKLEAEGWVRVEKDDIREDRRLFPDGYKYPKDERKVVKERDRLVREALRSGQNVVSADTNLNPQNIKQLISIAKEFDAVFEIDDTFLNVPLRELIERDSKREKSIGEQAIREQFHKWVKKLPTFVEWDDNLPVCVISDIDGTLTLGPKNRSPYEWHKVGNDDVNIGTAHILDGVKVINYAKVIIFSGRDEVCRPETEDWLDRHDIEYDELYMRRTGHVDENGNQVKDTVVKAEFFEKYIRGKYNVLFIMDDRPQVVRLWQDYYGLNVLALGDQRYEF